MADDEQYQREARQITTAFAASDWQTLQEGGSDR
jgi:hypothetical protein